MSATKVALYALASGLVLDRSVFASFAAADVALTIEQIRAEPTKELVVVDRADKFFTSDNLLTLIKANDDDYKLVAEQAGITITDATVAAILEAERAKALIVESMTPPIPPYTFTKIPEGWSIETDLAIDKTRVQRRRGFNGVGRGYPLSINQTQRLWAVASKFWAGTSTDRSVKNVRADGYDKNAYVNLNNIDVGCQQVQRYELEQLALHLGWAFPEPKA